MTTVFIAYSHEDEPLRVELDRHLSKLKRQRKIDAWHDRRLAPGDEWRGVIDEKLDDATIVLLLVSADFLNSDYCYDVEMRHALEKHSRGEARAIPVILRPCDWKHSPLGELQALPTDGQPIMKFPDRDEAFLDVVEGLRKILPSHAAADDLPGASRRVLGSRERRHKDSPDPDRAIYVSSGRSPTANRIRSLMSRSSTSQTTLRTHSPNLRAATQAYRDASLASMRGSLV